MAKVRVVQTYAHEFGPGKTHRLFEISEDGQKTRAACGAHPHGTEFRVPEEDLVNIVDCAHCRRALGFPKLESPKD